MPKVSIYDTDAVLNTGVYSADIPPLISCGPMM